MSNIIRLDIAREKDHRKKCKHYHLEVNEESSSILCLDCNEQLNPIWVLMRYAYEESRFKRDRKKYIEAVELYNKKQRTKCQHCGRMTKVRI